MSRRTLADQVLGADALQKNRQTGDWVDPSVNRSPLQTLNPKQWSEHFSAWLAVLPAVVAFIQGAHASLSVFAPLSTHACAGLNDPRVFYWEPAKMTAKLRALRSNDALLLLKVGHG
jgi:hypothetical protein